MIVQFKRVLAVAMLSVLMAGCKVIPGGEGPGTTGPVIEEPAPPVDGLPQDEGRHRIALLVPLSGENAAVGQSIANATTMALLDTNADSLRITTYDTASNAAGAAQRAIADGNKLILGPLQRGNVEAVLSRARPAGVPLITFSNDLSVAQNDVFVMGQAPEQSIARTVQFAIGKGARRFAAVVPNGEYGDRALAALRDAVQRGRGEFVAAERYDRGNRSVISAANRLDTRGGFDTVLIADGARMAILAGDELKDAGEAVPSIIGPELWSGEIALAGSPVMRGSWFSAVSDARFRQFESSYETRFGSRPHRISTLGYDAVLLTLRIARDWTPGRAFPTRALTDDGGFLGLDGPFRFRSDGVGERAMEVRQVGNGTMPVVDAAPTKF